MLLSLCNLRNYMIGATDGDLGSLRDFYFDDCGWVIRYFVVDTGAWLSGRRVLVTPGVVARADWPSHRIFVNLTQEQVRESPDVDTHKPVSRQTELKLTRYWKWAPYWEAMASAAGPDVGSSTLPTEATTEERLEKAEVESGESGLRSVKEVTGYYVAAIDGRIGHVEDFIAEEETWAIQSLVIDTRNWLPGRKVLISPRSVSRIDWRGAQVQVNLSQEAIRNSRDFDPSVPVNRQEEVRLYDYCRRPMGWE